MNLAVESSTANLPLLRTIERRTLWLAARIVDYANRERPKEDEPKVGGHQASSASLVSLMTALYFHDLDANDRVSVKPHASPVLHAIDYLLGRLDRSYLLKLREFGGLQSYPSRLKDPVAPDYSTGSVGLGAVAPLFGALADRYVATHFGRSTGGRFISLLGDAELDEGNVWEAIIEPLGRGLGTVLWIVDLNRQSLDRVVPGIKASQLEAHFRAAGWNVLELKYGRRLRRTFAREGGHLLRSRIDEMPNEQYQGLFGASEEVARETLLDGYGSRDRATLDTVLAQEGGDLGSLISDLGGHDIGDILTALSSARGVRDRPTVIFAYTIKGYGLPSAGHPQNHSALLTGEQIDEFRQEMGLTRNDEWDAFDPATPEGQLCREAARRLTRPEGPHASPIPIPPSFADTTTRRTSTQAAFGGILLRLSRLDAVAERLVTVSPDVSVSTNLGGWINKAGVWGPTEEPAYNSMADSALSWHVSPSGRHIEMGIAEMNLVLLLGQLGLTSEFQQQRLLPIGTLYDPFVMRALEGIVYAVYSGARFILVGTPSGISLSREGGAHQSLNTPGIGMETPSLSYAEPCFADELEWLLLDGLDRLQRPDGESLYLRLSTKPIDQHPFVELAARRGEDALRRDVLAGGFRLLEPEPEPEQYGVVLASCGAMVPETLEAAELLRRDEGVAALVLVLSSPDRLYRDWRANALTPLTTGRLPLERSHMEKLVRPEERRWPLVTVIDGASHALSFVGGCLGMHSVPLGVDRFGQVGSQQAVYTEYGISPEAIVTAALIGVERTIR